MRLLSILLLLPVMTHAQRLHKQDLIGKWRIYRTINRGDTITDRQDTMKMYQAAFEKYSFFIDPSSKEDSLNMINYVNKKLASYISFGSDSYVEADLFSKQGTGTYTFDENTNTLNTTIQNRNKRYSAELENGILTLTECSECRCQVIQFVR